MLSHYSLDFKLVFQVQVYLNTLEILLNVFTLLIRIVWTQKRGNRVTMASLGFAVLRLNPTKQQADSRGSEFLRLDIHCVSK